MKFWDNKGNIAVMASLTMPIIVGGAGLGVETGYWYYEQLKLQQAADAAAYAAALEHYQGNVDAMLPSATDAADQNGFVQGDDEINMTWPSATYPGNERSVDIALAREIPRGFSALFGKDPIRVGVKATAKYEPQTSACLLALSKSASNSVWIKGNAAMTIDGCVISSNSLSGSSINSQGSSSAVMPCMSTAGGVSLTAGVSFTDPKCTQAKTGQMPVADPYKDLPMPTPGPCKSWPTGMPRVHSPGTYCNTPNITNTIHEFQPGTYIFSGENADLTVNGNGGMKCLAPGCTFIFMNGAQANLAGNVSQINIEAPTTGPYAGMLFVGDRTGTPESQKFNGNAFSSMTGTIYFPNDNVDYNGNFGGFNGCTQVVANTIMWSGSTELKVDCSAFGMDDIKVGGRPYLVG